MEIKTISAMWLPGQERSEVYRLLNMVHSMAGSMANSDSRQKTWGLSATSTTERFVMTEWTNGIVNVGAETRKDYDGEVESHYYYLRPVATPNELEGE